jgi:hypothetical protein
MNLNLWADSHSDEQHKTSSLSATIRLSHRASQRRVEATIISSLRAWLLTDYCAAYCRSLRATPLYRRCYWIDAWGFDARAAAGSPETENAEKSPAQKRAKKKTAQPDSPLLQPFAQLSQTLTNECPTRPFVLHGIVLEERAMPKKAGAAASEQPIWPRESGIVRANWHEHGASLLANIEQAPAIFLLNPFGQTLFVHDDLAPLSQRTTAPTELCLLISHRQVARHMTTATHNPNAASAITALLRTDKWKALTTKQDALDPIAGVIDLLHVAIRKHLPFAQSLAVPVIRQPVAITDAPYTLLFATRRKDSLHSMNDAVCLHQRRLEEESRRGLLSESWFAEQQAERLDQERQALYDEVVRQGQIQRIRRWPDLRQQLLLSHFGRFTLAEYDAIIQRLLQENRVHCQWRKQDNEPIPGMDDMLLWK